MNVTQRDLHTAAPSSTPSSKSARNRRSSRRRSKSSSCHRASKSSSSHGRMEVWTKPTRTVDSSKSSSSPLTPARKTWTPTSTPTLCPSSRHGLGEEGNHPHRRARDRWQQRCIRCQDASGRRARSLRRCRVCSRVAGVKLEERFEAFECASAGGPKLQCY